MAWIPLPIRSASVVGAALLAATFAPAQHRIAPERSGATAFAIVVDTATWQAVPAAIRAYRRAVEADGLATWILVDDWRRPESVRDALRSLHQGKPALEGALLVGRIPVPMVRGAQHLTTAFKLDERRYPRRRSSVPSDRLYEDFDLVVEFQGQDDKQPLLSYYQLAPDSTQRIAKEIYTARLFPPGTGTDPQAIAACLQRFVQAHQSPQPLDRALTLMGHGYVSESLDAWAATRLALTEQVPALRIPGGALVELHHSRGVELKDTLLRELADPRLDLAVLHSHGDADRQYLTGAPELPSTPQQIAAVKRYLRGRLRRARDRGQQPANTQQELTERLGVPADWFANAFDEATTAADAAVAARAELPADEVAKLVAGARVIHLDSCFNGNFTADPYQAAAYLFGKGRTTAVIANSVNIAQDVWADRFLGMLAAGQRVGAWHRRRPHLESHLFGDPTFRFAAGPRNEVLARQDRAAEATDDAALTATLRNDPASVVRLEALRSLARHRGAAFEQALPAAATDPAEIVRRRAVALMGDVGRPEYLAPLLHCALRDPSQRVVFEARNALRKFTATAVAAAMPAALRRLPAPPADPAALLRSCQTAGFIGEYLTRAQDRKQPLDKRIAAVRTFRLYRVHGVVDDLLDLAGAGKEQPALRVATLEALGWFGFSIHRPAIAAAVAGIAADDQTPAEVRIEARKTVRRLATGANDPVLP